mmetsp:Transcript_31803/g.92948  ORF Transcript_31803/g.92948 Transcript_31803/m.92948 type:complete len:262 (-) Transcript_31803:975-1760(-)
MRRGHPQQTRLRGVRGQGEVAAEPSHPALVVQAGEVDLAELLGGDHPGGREHRFRRAAGELEAAGRARVQQETAIVEEEHLRRGLDAPGGHGGAKGCTAPATPRDRRGAAALLVVHCPSLHANGHGRQVGRGGHTAGGDGAAARSRQLPEDGRASREVADDGGLVGTGDDDADREPEHCLREVQPQQCVGGRSRVLVGVVVVRAMRLGIRRRILGLQPPLQFLLLLDFALLQHGVAHEGAQTDAIPNDLRHREVLAVGDEN